MEKHCRCSKQKIEKSRRSQEKGEKPQGYLPTLEAKVNHFFKEKKKRKRTNLKRGPKEKIRFDEEKERPKGKKKTKGKKEFICPLFVLSSLSVSGTGI